MAKVNEELVTLYRTTYKRFSMRGAGGVELEAAGWRRGLEYTRTTLVQDFSCVFPWCKIVLVNKPGVMEK